MRKVLVDLEPGWCIEGRHLTLVADDRHALSDRQYMRLLYRQQAPEMKKSRLRVLSVVQPAVRKLLHPLSDGGLVRGVAWVPDWSCLLVREQLQKEPIVLTSAKADQTEKAYHVGEQEKQRWHVEPIQL